MKRLRLVLVGLVAWWPAAAPAQHSHGAAKLDVAVEGPKLVIELEAPLEDLVGFEREPRDAKERASVEAALAFLGSGRALVPSEAAGCRAETRRAERDSTRDGHAEARLSITLTCSRPDALRQLDAKPLLARFPRLKRIDARIVTGKGQSTARLTAAKPSLNLSGGHEP